MAGHMAAQLADPHLTRLERALTHAVNCVSAEAGSNTPDFVLGMLLAQVVAAFDAATRARDKWFGVRLEPGGRRGCPPCPDQFDEVQRQELVRARLAEVVAGQAPGVMLDRLVAVVEQLAGEGLLSKVGRP